MKTRTIKISPKAFILSLVLSSFALLPLDADAQYPYPSFAQGNNGYNPQPVIIVPQVIAPPPLRFGNTNTAGFHTGYRSESLKVAQLNE